MAKKEIDTEAPTYSFDEVIEFLRTNDDGDTIRIMSQVVESEMTKYCLFHAELIAEAFRIRYTYKDIKNKK